MTVFVSKTADHLVPTICLVMSSVTHPLYWVSVQSLCLPVAMQMFCSIAMALFYQPYN